MKPTTNEDSSPEATAETKRISQQPKLFSEAFLVIASLKQLDPETAKQVALKSIVPANHPIIGK